MTTFIPLWAITRAGDNGYRSKHLPLALDTRFWSALEPMVDGTHDGGHPDIDPAITLGVPFCELVLTNDRIGIDAFWDKLRLRLDA